MSIRGSLLALAALFLLLPAPAPAQGSAQPQVVVGTVDLAAGQAWLLKNKLRKQFGDGGAIRVLKVRQYADGFHLVRIGTAANGNCRTESIPLQLSGNRLIATSVRWMTTCDSAQCTSFCLPNRGRTACDCNGNIGSLGTSDLIDEFDVESQHTGGGEPAHCNFGIDVSGVELDTIVVG